MNFLFRKNKAWFVFYHYVLLISGLFYGLSDLGICIELSANCRLIDCASC